MIVEKLKAQSKFYLLIFLVLFIPLLTVLIIIRIYFANRSDVSKKDLNIPTLNLALYEKVKKSLSLKQHVESTFSGKIKNQIFLFGKQDPFH